MEEDVGEVGDGEDEQVAEKKWFPVEFRQKYFFCMEFSTGSSQFSVIRIAVAQQSVRGRGPTLHYKDTQNRKETIFPRKGTERLQSQSQTFMFL